MADKKQPIAGKGSGRRAEDFRAVQNNWDEIPNFGFKPKWARKCDCHYHKRQACDICQKITGNELDKKVKKT